MKTPPRTPLPPSLPLPVEGESCCQVSLPAFRRQEMSESHSSRWMSATKRYPGDSAEHPPPLSASLLLNLPGSMADHSCSCHGRLRPFLKDAFVRCCFLFSRVTVKAHWLHRACLSLGSSQECVPPLFPKVQGSMFLTSAESWSVTSLWLKDEWVNWGTCFNLPF